jgi:hypothetical protein
MKKFLLIILILFAVIAALVFFSPYKSHPNRGHAIIKTIEIEATQEELYNYLGHSDNAADWSSYVSHIETMNEEEFADGEKGSTRRCYQKDDETNTWDERIELAYPYSYRRLSIYNMQGFVIKSDALLTEQLYDEIDSATTRLSLTLYIDPDKGTWTDHLKLYIASYKVGSVFEANLKKIKTINEK